MFDAMAMVEAGRKWAGADAAACSDDELFEAVVVLEQVRNLVDAAEGHVLAELEARDACDTTFGLRTAPWVAAGAGVAPGSVKARLRVARVLRERLPEVDEALSSGVLSFDHARVLAEVCNPRVADALADLQAEVIALAEGCTFDRWKTDVRALVELLDHDGVEPDDPTLNKLSMVATLDGVTHLKGTLGAHLGLVLRTAVDAKADELFRRFTRDHEVASELVVPPRATLTALALAELVRIAVGADPTATAAPRAEVTLVLHDHELTDTDGNPLPRAAAGVWGCDPDLWAVLVDSMGIPLDVGRARRLATVAQRRAIAVRDGGCTFRACPAPITWTHIHHLDHWTHGGRTDLHGLAPQCPHHHEVSHRPGWTMHATPDGWFWWQTPTGHTFWGQRHHRQRTDPAPTHCPGCPGCHRDQNRAATAGERDP